MLKKQKYPIISFLIFIITLVVNYLSTSGLIGSTQKEISDRYRNFITPDSFAFSIWGIIYLLIFSFLIYQIYLVFKNRYNNETYDQINKYFILTCILNIIWNILWVNNQIELSTIFIFLLTIVLAMLNMYILDNKKLKISTVAIIAFSLYFGWLTVATVTNVAALLVKIEWNMFGISEHIWTYITYIVIMILAIFLQNKIKNPLYSLPIIWAFVAIISMLNSDPYKTPVPEYAILMAIILIVVLSINSIYQFIKNENRLIPVK